jgi:biopolymer transport protein TolR
MMHDAGNFEQPTVSKPQRKESAMAATEMLTAGERAKVRRLSAPKELAPDEEGGELNIVPFLDIITNVLMFVLATITVIFTATVDVSPPRASKAGPQVLGLTVLVVPEGFSIKAKGGNVAPGCDALGAGLSVPKVDGKYDFAGLGRCASKLKASSDAFANESSVTISASPNISYQSVIGAMDAVRKSQDGSPLFPDVNFGIAP